MPVSRKQRRVVLALIAVATASVAACDAGATAPVPATRQVRSPAAIEGDTTLCRRGWTIVNGWYVCNEDL